MRAGSASTVHSLSLYSDCFLLLLALDFAFGRGERGSAADCELKLTKTTDSRYLIVDWTLLQWFRDPIPNCGLNFDPEIWIRRRGLQKGDRGEIPRRRSRV
ncbi:unnamed protein product [Linum trigynum]|uniref:Secreted protein n=1 Tax=Linum trigynum TaxID=586398 RepID=A0AAV2CYD8_9ROSI